MVNPSTADTETDDATIRKVIGFSERLGFGEIVVGNLFAYRATDIRALRTAADPIGPHGGDHLRAIMRGGEKVIVAWGPCAKLPRWLRNRWMEVAGIAEANRIPLWCLGTAQDGHPLHPLMLGYDRQLRLWERPAAAPKIEARRAEMRSSSVEDESLVTEGQAPEPPPAAPSTEGEIEVLIRRHVWARANGDAVEILGFGAAAAEITAGPLAHLRSELTAAREERDRARVEAAVIRGLMSENMTIEVVEDGLPEAEANLIALAKMYGEACGRMVALYGMYQDATENADQWSEECDHNWRQRCAAEAEASTLREQVARLEEALETAARVVETYPERILQMYARGPHDPPGNGYRATTRADLAAAIRALSPAPPEHVTEEMPSHGSV